MRSPANSQTLSSPALAVLFCFFAALACFSFASPPRAGAECIHYDDYFHAVGGYLPDGYLHTADFEAPYLYVAEVLPNQITLVDAADPARMRMAGEVGLSSSPRDLDVSGSLACVVLDSSTLQLVDVSQPDAPELLGSAAVPSTPNAVAISGSYAYVAAADYVGARGVFVYDIANPAVPTLLTHVPVGSDPQELGIDGRYAYVLDAFEVTVLDLVDPAAPVIAETLSIPGYCRFLAFRDDYLYVICQCNESLRSFGDGLYIVDKSDPLHLALVGSYAPEERAPMWGLAFWRDYAIVAGGDPGLAFLDISDPAAPRMVARAGIQAWAYFFHVQDDVLFACSDRVVSYALREPFTPDPVSWVPHSLACASLAVLGDHAYAVRVDPSELVVIDMGDPADPAVIGREPLPFPNASVLAVAPCDDRIIAYVGGSGYPDTTAIVDVTDPRNPRTAGSLIVPHHPSDLVVQGGYLYAVCGVADVRIYSIADPLHPLLVSVIEFTYSAQTVDVSGTRLYVGRRIADMEHLFIYDVSDPAQPRFLGASMLSECPYEIVIRDDLAYIADGARGMLILDVGDPGMPALVSRLEVFARAQDIALSGDRAYVTDWTGVGALQVIDISDPAAPALAGTFQAEMPFQLEVINDCVLMTCITQKTVVAPLDCVSSALPAVTHPASARRQILSLSSNPTCGDLSVSFAMPAASDVRLLLVDAAGRLVRVLYDGRLDGGPHVFQWDGRDRAGRPAPGGVHYVSLETEGGRGRNGFVLVR